MKHYIVINDWSNEYECGVTIIAVAHSLEEAKESFNECIAEEKAYVEDKGWTIYEDSDVDFDAGEEGYYAANHTRLYIQEV